MSQLHLHSPPLSHYSVWRLHLKEGVAQTGRLQHVLSSQATQRSFHHSSKGYTLQNNNQSYHLPLCIYNTMFRAWIHFFNVAFQFFYFYFLLVAFLLLRITTLKMQLEACDTVDANKRKWIVIRKPQLSSRMY